MRTVIPIVLSVLVFPTCAFAQEKFDPAARAAKIAPIIDRTDSAVVHLDLRRIDPDAVWVEVASWGPIGKLPGPQAIVTLLKDTRKSLLAAGVRDVYALGLPAPIEGWPLPGLVAAYVEADGDLDAAAKPFEAFKFGAVVKHERLVIFLPADWKESFQPAKPARAERYEAAFRLAGDTDLQIVFPRIHGREVTEWINRYPLFFPPWFDHEQHHESLRSLTFSMNFPPRAAVAWIAPTYEETPPEDVLETIEEFVWPLPSDAFPPELMKNVILKPSVKDGVLRTLFTDKNGAVPALRAVLAEAFGDPMKKQRRLLAQQNLRYIMLGMSDYSVSMKKGLKDSTAGGKPLLSWRVHILPFIQQQALYEQFKLDEPWDSEHNQKLVGKMPKVFAAPYNTPEEHAAGKTAYLSFRGKKCVMDMTEDDSFDTDQDPLDKTYFVLEAPPNRAVIWTKPEDFPFDPKNPLNGLDSAPHGVFFFGTLNGTIGVMHADKMDADALRSAVLLGE